MQSREGDSSGIQGNHYSVAGSAEVTEARATVGNQERTFSCTGHIVQVACFFLDSPVRGRNARRRSGCAGAPFPPERSLHPRTTRGSHRRSQRHFLGPSGAGWPNSRGDVHRRAESPRVRWRRSCPSGRARRAGAPNEIAARRCGPGAPRSVCTGRRRPAVTLPQRSIWTKTSATLTQRGASGRHLVDETAVP